MTNYKKYKNKETGEEVEAIVLFDLKNKPFLFEIVLPTHKLTCYGDHEETIKFIQQYEEIND